MEGKRSHRSPTSATAVVLTVAADLHHSGFLRVLAVFAAILLVTRDATITGRMRTLV
jgi:hypothetical protein